MEFKVEKEMRLSIIMHRHRRYAKRAMISVL